MASRKDKNKGSDDNRSSPSAQQALENYLDLMLGVLPAHADESLPAEDESPQDVPIAPPSPISLMSSVTSPTAGSPTTAPRVQPDDKFFSSPHSQYSPDARPNAEVLRSANVQLDEQAQAKPTMLAESAALQQKLVQARVKDLTEKSLQNVDAQARKAAHADADRRERLAAVRDLVKQRIAARAAPIEKIAPPEPAQEQQVAPAQKQLIEPVQAQLSVETETSVETVAISPVEKTVLPPAPQWLANGRPAWAQSAFECLLFSVSGLVLAVPLIELGSIYPLREHLTPIIGQVDWFLGLMHIDGRKNLRTVNTAKIVMPEKYDPAFIDQIRYVISINGHDWGLAVDKIDKAVTLKPDDVRWRSERSRRPWLAGTVVDYMCALVDVQELALMLSLSDHSRPAVRH